MDQQKKKNPEAGWLAGTLTVPLYAEGISVTTRKSATGAVRVSTVTREHEEVVEQQLRSERVIVEHVPVGKTVSEMPQMRRDGETIIVPIVDEVLVTERRLVLREELHIRREEKTEKHQERVKLRKQEARITRLAAGEAGTESGSGAEGRIEK